MIQPKFLYKQKINREAQHELLKQFIVQNPNNINILFQIGEYEMMQNKINEGEKYLEKVLTHSEITPKLVFNIAAIYYHIGNPKRSEELISTIDQSVKDNNINIKFFESKLAYKRRDFDKAESICQQILLKDENNKNALLKLVQINTEKGNKDTAISICKNILSEHPHYVPAVEIYNNLYFQLNSNSENNLYVDFDEQIRVYDLNSLNPKIDIEALNNRINEKLLDNSKWVEDPKQYTTNKGSQLSDIFNIKSRKDSDFKLIEKLLQQTIVKYINKVSSTQNPFYNEVPQELTTTTWAVNLTKGGHQTAHIHRGAYISGVYYTSIPNFDKLKNEGAIEFGIFGNNKTFESMRIINPHSGVLVLFPSYTLHRTVPFDNDNSRICLAFDVYQFKSPKTSLRNNKLEKSN